MNAAAALLLCLPNYACSNVSAMIRPAISTAFIASGLCFGPGHTQHQPPNNLFTAAGFVVRHADTPEKMEHLKRFPSDKLVVRMRNGKQYYVYADPTICRCAYVGTAEAYRAFQTGAVASGSSGRSGESIQQEVSEFTDDLSAAPGARSFDDYVFGGFRDD
jgi:hypothetical protein